MQIDPNLMNKEYEESREKATQRYQKKAIEPAMMIDDEEEMVFQPEEHKEKEERPKLAKQDEEILPGLFLSDVTAWKKQFNDEVYMATIKDVTFVFRSLKRFEYKEITGIPNTNALMREELICEYCVLYPNEYTFASMAEAKAGLPAVLSEMIMDYSGFTRDVQIRKL